MKIGKFIKFVFVIIYVFLVLVITWLAYLTQSGNFYEIAPGIYRSHQLYYFNLPYFYQKYRFKSILNLRGSHPDKSWYKYEVAFCKEHNITLINFGFSDKEVQSLKTMKKLIEIIKKAKKPLLIHCKAGADRTGLASALYLYSIGDKNASKMLSLKYGHFPYFGSPTKAMDKSFQKWVKNN